MDKRLNDRQPWLTEKSIPFIKKYISGLTLQNLEVKVFEYGAGGSTLFFSDQEKVNLTTVENDKEWIKFIMKNRKNQFSLIISERPYHEAINIYSKEYFDIILVDGRERVKCIKESLGKLKYGGILILDNSEREHYKSAIDLMDEFIRIDFKQEKPDKYGFTYPGWTTSIFVKSI